MKRLFYLSLLSVLIGFSFCKKTNTTTSSASKTNTEAQAISYMVGGKTWIWDSTVFYNGAVPVYCYTKDQLKTYTLSTTVISCTTSSTFSLTTTNTPYQNTGDGSAYANTYSEYSNFWTQRLGQMQLKAVYKNSNDSTINLDQTWGWMIGPNSNDNDMNVLFKGTTTSLHKCASTTGYISFGSAEYIIQDISSNSFVFQQIISPATDVNLAKYYFHR